MRTHSGERREQMSGLANAECPRVSATLTDQRVSCLWKRRGGRERGRECQTEAAASEPAVLRLQLPSHQPLPASLTLSLSPSLSLHLSLSLGQPPHRTPCGDAGSPFTPALRLPPPPTLLLSPPPQPPSFLPPRLGLLQPPPPPPHPPLVPPTLSTLYSSDSQLWWLAGASAHRETKQAAERERKSRSSTACTVPESLKPLCSRLKAGTH